MWQTWLIVSGICFVIEMITTGFLFFWPAIGAILAMITSFFTDNLIIQIAVFVISSSLLILFTKPFVKKFLNDKDTMATNAYSIIGKSGLVTQEINSALGTGQVKIGTETWSAKCNEHEVIEKGTKVEIISIDGVKAIVSSQISETEKISN